MQNKNINNKTFSKIHRFQIILMWWAATNRAWCHGLGSFKSQHRIIRATQNDAETAISSTRWLWQPWTRGDYLFLIELVHPIMTAVDQRSIHHDFVTQISSQIWPRHWHRGREWGRRAGGRGSCEIVTRNVWHGQNIGQLETCWTHIMLYYATIPIVLYWSLYIGPFGPLCRTFNNFTNLTAGLDESSDQSI